MKRYHKSAEDLSDTSKEIGLEVIKDKTKYVCMSHDPIAEQGC